ncbi:MAG: hypothetical protein NTW60_01230, partial [Candidatus Wolfebacteria bacterium]|nr:hypothetical protein [Candidatus Wolfebacteria bacterium]
ISLFKYIFSVLIFILVATSSGFGLLVLQKAHAMTVEDLVMEAEGAAIAASNERTADTTLADFVEKVAEWGLTVARWVKDDLMKALRDVVAKKIMDYIVNETVRWIQGGGSPKFVSSWSGLAKNAGNIAFDTVIKQVGLARLCSPFSLQVKLSLLPVQDFPTQISCTLDQFVSNINNFYVDFNQGGWPAYSAMWNPENTYYGQMLMIQDNLQLESAKKVTAAMNEAISGSGFLSVKKCVDPVYSDQVTGIESYCQVYDSDTGECAVQGVRDITTKVQTGCNKEEIQTPAMAVGEAAKNAIGSDSQWGANIQSWVSALAQALINRVMTEGFAALKNAVTGSSGSGSSGSSATSAYQNLVSSELANQKTQLGSSLSSALKEEQYLLNAKNKTLSAYQMQQVYLLKMSTTTGCFASQADIGNVERNIVDLNGQAAALQSAITEITNAISAINKATSAIDLAQGTYTSGVVSDKYNTVGFLTQIQTGSARTAADNEAIAAQIARDSAYNSLVLCTTPSTAGGVVPGN